MQFYNSINLVCKVRPMEPHKTRPLEAVIQNASQLAFVRTALFVPGPKLNHPYICLPLSFGYVRIATSINRSEKSNFRTLSSPWLRPNALNFEITRVNNFVYSNVTERVVLASAPLSTIMIVKTVKFSNFLCF